MNETDKNLIAEDHQDRSKFIYDFLQKKKKSNTQNVTIPKTIMQFWHSLDDIPEDVLECVNSWKILENKGFKFDLFDDNLAREFIKKHLGSKYFESYLKCHHPAMRCDYFRLCYLYILGGFYIDCDELFLDQDISFLFKNNNLKVQPLCYSLEDDKMVEKESFFHQSYDVKNIYYFNNNPIVCPPKHSLINIALERATDRLMREENIFDIQSTTGPGNLSASIVYYLLSGNNEIEYLANPVSKNIWSLEYRKDDRNWRRYKGQEKKWFE